MFLEIFSLLILGILIGVITGLTPGIHVNLVATTLFSLSPFLLIYLHPLSICVFIISVAITHSFLDTIPSIYLGAPENENALSVLPGQKMLLQGEAYKAVKITILGTYSGMLVSVFLIPFFILIAKHLYLFLRQYVAYVLLVIIGFMIVKEKHRFWAFLVFMLSGALGLIVFSLDINEPLFPLLSGLFGVSGMLISFFENTKIPEQRYESSLGIDKNDLFKALFGSTIGVFFIQFFPGLGPAQGAVIASQFVKNMKDKIYLALVGAQGTMSVVFSLVTFYTLGKAKDGSIAVISKIMSLDNNGFIILVGAMIFSGSISVILVIFFSKIFSNLVVRVNYRMLVTSIICFILMMSFIINGFIGCIIVATGAAIGVIAPMKGVGRNHAMGCLLLPVVLYFFL